MAENLEFKVPLRDMPVRKSFALDAAFVREAVAGLAVRSALERPEADPDAGEARADLQMTVEGENVFVRGTIRGWVEVACSRCVGPVRLALDDSVQVTFLPRHLVPEDPGVEDEIELTEEDLDVYPYEGKEIDLEPLLREQVILGVPFAPLCAEDCKGLCPVCGADRNLEACACADPVDPRLAGLKNLKV